MNFNEFINEIKERVEIKLGEEYKVSLNHVIKNNGVELDAILICKSGMSVVPNIYLNDYYSLYVEEYSIDTIECIVKSVIEKYEAAINSNIINSIVVDYTYDVMVDKIYYKVVNYEKNIKMLDTIPHVRFLDLAIIFYGLVTEDSDGIMSIRITNEHLKSWKKSIGDLLEVASKNTPILFPGVIRSMVDVIKDLIMKNPLNCLFDDFDNRLCEDNNKYYFNGPKLKESMIDEMLNQVKGKSPKDMYVLTNKTGINGATTILYNGLIEKFANSINSNIFILPCSIHEVILIPYTDEFDIEDLKNMVKEVNLTKVEDADILSDSVYIYNRSECSIMK